jgi:hypothetical protein
LTCRAKNAVFIAIALKSSIRPADVRIVNSCVKRGLVRCIGLLMASFILVHVQGVCGAHFQSSSREPWPATEGREQNLRFILQNEPEDDQAYAELLELTKNRKLGHESFAYRCARQALPERFKEYQSRRFIVLSDAESAWTRSQVQLLERAHHQFQRFAKRLDLRPLPLEHKLLCVLFERRDDYWAFARSNDGVSNQWMTGYYSPKHDWIIFYNVHESPQVVTASEDLGSLRKDIDELRLEASKAALRGDHEDAQAMRAALRKSQQHFRLQQQHLDEFVDREIVATTIHECIHQLLFHTGVQTPRIRYPLWISEGLATCFETRSPWQAFGPDCEFTPRRERFEELLAEQRLLSLNDLIVIDRIDSVAEADVLYQQSYALVRWMARFRTAQLREYLMLLLHAPDGELKAADYRELFEKAFGDVVALERAWLRHERDSLAKPN